MEDMGALATVFMSGIFASTHCGIIEGNGEKLQ